MKSKLIKTALILAVIFGLGLLLVNSSYAVDDACKSLEKGSAAYEAAGCGGNGNTLPSVIVGILNAVIGITGLIAVVVIIIGGVQYITSSGDAGKVQKAKNTIIYAVIGLVVCVLSFAIVNWTIGAINGSGNKKNDPSNYTEKTDCENAGFKWDDASGKCK